MSAEPDYGIDAPGVIRNLLLIGAATVGASLFLKTIHFGSARIAVGRMLLITGSVLIVEGVLMLLYAKFGKFRHREHMLRMIRWRGDEQVLDVGTGRGLLLIGAAKRLGSGKAMGIDIWNATDLSGNSMEATLNNADIEGVRNKVELKTEDASRMSFPDACFDAIVSNLCLHNIAERSARDSACREILRVLKPGGIAVISDYKNTREYAHVFAESGATVERHGAAFLYTFPPLRVVAAKKPS